MTTDSIKQEVAVLEKILLEKNKLYGDSAGESPRLVPVLTPQEAILVRIGDKIKRLETLAALDYKGTRDETFQDTVRDLAGYCVLYLSAVKPAPAVISASASDVIADIDAGLDDFEGV